MMSMKFIKSPLSLLLAGCLVTAFTARADIVIGVASRRLRLHRDGNGDDPRLDNVDHQHHEQGASIAHHDPGIVCGHHRAGFRHRAASPVFRGFFR